MKLWVDDEREAPDKSWLVARSFDAALELLSHWDHGVVWLSLDHDLGEDRTGYDLVTALETQLWEEGIEPPARIECHSANPPGHDRILQAIASIQRRPRVTMSSTSRNVTFFDGGDAEAISPR